MKQRDITALEQLDLSLHTAHGRLRVDWFRAIQHYELPNLEWHAHDSFEIHFQKEGRIAFQFPDDRLELMPSEALLIPETFPHRLENPSSQLYFRYVLSATVEQPIQDPEMAFLAAALHVTVPTIIPMDTHILELLDTSLAEAQEKSGGYLTVIESNLLLILMTLAREISQTHPVHYRAREKKTMDRYRMDEILPLLESASNGVLRVEDIARRIHLSPRQLQRVVLAETGMTPKQIMTHRRLQNAKELLRNPDLSVSEIAQLLGFASEQSFSRFFQQTAGQTPLAYRNGTVPRKMPD